jgi:hypothetical protein
MANVGSVEEVRDNAAELGQDPAASIDTTPTPDLTPERDIVGAPEKCTRPRTPGGSYQRGTQLRISAGVDMDVVRGQRAVRPG